MPGPLTSRHKGTVCGDDETSLIEPRDSTRSALLFIYLSIYAAGPTKCPPFLRNIVIVCAFAASHPWRQRTTVYKQNYSLQAESLRTALLTYVLRSFRQLPPLFSCKTGPATSSCNSSPTVKISTPAHPRFCRLQQQHQKFSTEQQQLLYVSNDR